MVVIYVCTVDVLEIERIAQLWQGDIFSVKRTLQKQFCVIVQRVGYSLIRKPREWPWGTETADVVRRSPGL